MLARPEDWVLRRNGTVDALKHPCTAIIFVNREQVSPLSRCSILRSHFSMSGSG